LRRKLQTPFQTVGRKKKNRKTLVRAFFRVWGKELRPLYFSHPRKPKKKDGWGTGKTPRKDPTSHGGNIHQSYQQTKDENMKDSNTHDQTRSQGVGKKKNIRKNWKELIIMKPERRVIRKSLRRTRCWEEKKNTPSNGKNPLPEVPLDAPPRGVRKQEKKRSGPYKKRGGLKCSGGHKRKGKGSR